MAHSRFICFCLVALLAGLAASATAKSSWVKDFRKKYPETIRLKSGNPCQLCHANFDKSPRLLTVYGKAFKEARGATLAEKFAKIEKVDSDKDGFTNLAEIKGGSNPNDPKARPKGTPDHAAAKDVGTSATVAAAPPHPRPSRRRSNDRRAARSCAGAHTGAL